MIDRGLLGNVVKGSKPTTQLGTVLVFKPGVTAEQAKSALDKLAPLLEACWLDNPIKRSNSIKSYRLEEFDPKWGHPVWYVP